MGGKAAVAHELLNSLGLVVVIAPGVGIKHVGPVVGSGKCDLMLGITSIDEIVSLAGAGGRILKILENLCHSRSHTACQGR